MAETGLLALLQEESGPTWQARLWELLRLQTERYTMGRSTSVHSETAQALLRSLCFSLDQLRRTDPVRDLLTGPPEELLREAAEAVRRQAAKARLQYQRACRCQYQEESLALQETLRGIGSFFRMYDPRFFAAELPCDIDYQLARPVPDCLHGVDYIRAYLDRLLTEDAILRRFHPGAVRRLLEAACPGHRELLVNLYEPVAAAALGVTLTERDLFTLDITAAGQAALTGLLGPLPSKERKRLLLRAGETLARRLELGPAASDCLYETARDLLPRVDAVLASDRDWQALFPAFS